MGRSKTAHPDLPPRMTVYEGKKRNTYFYLPSTGARKKINLGHDINLAKKKWAELEDNQEQIESLRFEQIWQFYVRDELPKKAISTQKDNRRESKKLIEAFGKMLLDAIKPRHVKLFLTNRTAKTRANREKALLSHIFNYARASGYTDSPNPCLGIKGNKEKPRDRYIEDHEFEAVYKCADQTLKDVLDLLLFTGQRPSDILKMKRYDIKNGALLIDQGKTGARINILIEGRFKTVIDRIINKPIATIYLITNDKGQPLSYWTLTDKFKLARKKAGVNFQLRDIRAKNATDTPTVEEANKRLGHTTTQMTDSYRKSRKGETVRPLQ